MKNATLMPQICICAKKNPAIIGYVVRKERGKSIFTHFDSVDPERRAAFLLSSESFMNLHLLTSSSSLACIFNISSCLNSCNLLQLVDVCSLTQFVMLYFE